MNHTRLPRTLAGLLLAGLLLAACAEPDRGAGAAGQGAPTTVPTTLPDKRTEPIKPAVQVTVTGTVTEGVEAGCLLLHAEDGGQFLLVGGERAQLRPGRRVAVTGRVDRSLVGTCQQGQPLLVASIEPAP
jgi:Protein of unknown function (DUF5818)